MKIMRIMSLIGLVAFIPMLMGCATSYPAGFVYTELKLPVTAGSNAAALKTGTAESMSVFGIAAIGDASLNKAMQNGNITKISHADWEVKYILGYGKYKLTVYGE